MNLDLNQDFITGSILLKLQHNFREIKLQTNMATNRFTNSVLPEYQTLFSFQKIDQKVVNNTSDPNVNKILLWFAGPQKDKRRSANANTYRKMRRKMGPEEKKEFDSDIKRRKRAISGTWGLTKLCAH